MICITFTYTLSTKLAYDVLTSWLRGWVIISYDNFNRNNVAGTSNLVQFFRTLSPGTRVVLQFDAQRPASGIFQGFQNGTVLLTNFNGFPGVVRIAIRSINAVSVG